MLVNVGCVIAAYVVSSCTSNCRYPVGSGETVYKVNATTGVTFLVAFDDMEGEERDSGFLVHLQLADWLKPGQRGGGRGNDSKNQPVT